MHVAILTFQGFNELDSLIAFGILNRVKKADWRVSIACPTATSCYAVGFEGTPGASNALIVHLSGKGKMLGKVKTSWRSFSAIACPTDQNFTSPATILRLA